MTDLTKLKELAERATPGPWQADQLAVTADTRTQVCCGQAYMECCGDPEIEGEEFDPICSATSEPLADFIAAANPKAILGLIAEVERLRNVESLQKQVNEHYKRWYRECIDEPFDTWLKDDATHWIGEQDAAFQAWQYLHENKIWLMKERIEEHEQELDRLKAENATLQAALIEAVRVVAKTDPDGTAAWLAALEGGSHEHP